MTIRVPRGDKAFANTSPRSEVEEPASSVKPAAESRVTSVADQRCQEALPIASCILGTG